MNEPVDMLTILALPPGTWLKSGVYFVHAGCIEPALKYSSSLPSLLEYGLIEVLPEVELVADHRCYHCRGFPAWKK